MASGKASQPMPEGEQFHARINPTNEPNQKGGHQLGQKVTPADNAPQFSAQTLPPGSAPADRTFEPNPDPGVLQRDEGWAKADDWPTSTSKDVHKGLGMPVQGQTSSELHHDGVNPTRKKEHQGLGQYGAGHIAHQEEKTGRHVGKDAPVHEKTVDERPSESA